VSEWERNGRTLWAMAFTLSPAESRLKQRVTIYNRGKLPVSFMYWGNSRVPVGTDSRFIYTECMGTEHGGTSVFTWPEFRGVDMSWFRDDPEVIGIYYLDPRYNFFGLTDVRRKAGMVHFADRHDVPGKKLWTWARTPAQGGRWRLGSTDRGAAQLLVGLRGGTEREAHQPGALRMADARSAPRLEEQWAPIYGLTNVHEVTEDCAFQVVPEEARILAYPFTRKPLTLEVAVAGQTIKEVLLPSETSRLHEIDISEAAANGGFERMEARVVTAGRRTGTVSVVSRCVKRSAREVREDPIFSDHSPMAYFVNAEFSHKLLYRDRAARYYRKSLELDPLNYKAHTGLGLLQFLHGEFEASAASFKRR